MYIQKNKKIKWIILIIALIIIESSLKLNFAYIPVALSVTGFLAYRYEYKSLKYVLLIAIFVGAGGQLIYYIIFLELLAIFIIYVFEILTLEDVVVPALTILEIVLYFITLHIFQISHFSFFIIVVESTLVFLANYILFVYFNHLS